MAPPPITNAQAILFSNQYARVFANQMLQEYNTAVEIVNIWNAQQISLVITNVGSVIVDGAATDGRPIVTDSDVTNIITRAMERIADMTANSNAKLNTVLAVATSGQAAF